MNLSPNFLQRQYFCTTIAQLEKEMASHSSVLAWRISGTGEHGGLPSESAQSQTRLKRLSSSSSSSMCDTWASQVVALVKNLPATAGGTRDTGSIPVSGRSLGVGNGNPLQYSCWGNPMNSGAWQATVHGIAKIWTQVSS